MSIALWIVQALAAFMFLASGFMHAFRFESFASSRRTSWARDLGPARLRVIGLLEIAGAIGVILPGLVGVDPWLTGIAALGLVAIMIGAAAFHLRRSEMQSLPINAFMAAIAAIVAVGRTVVAPF
jgi:uncharacterized membrane protein YphA (DoxX/SURF4 family)